VSTALSVTAPIQAAPILARTVTWKSAFVISLGAALLISTSLGAIAGDLGPASVFVWTLIICIGILQCLMIAEMAGMFPNKSGGTAVYSHEAFKQWPFIGAIANWGYWCGWVPVIPVNLIVAAGYLKSFVPNMTDNQILIAAIVMALLLYALNYIGLKPGIWSSAVMAFCAIAPMIVIIASPALHPHLFHAANLFPFKPLNGSWHSNASWMLMFKWMFVALWSAYGIEAASTTIAELKNPHQDGPKAMLAASVGGFIAYAVLPFVMLGIVGVSVLTQDASVAFLPAAQAIFGHAGGIIVSIMLITALLLGVQTTIIGSSRSMYQMTQDGQMIKQFGIINKYGVPVGSMFVDMAVGYIIVWLVLIPAYVVLRIKQPDALRPFKLPGFFIPVAVLITLYNLFIFIVGGPQWDSTPVTTIHPFGHAVDLTVMGIGWAVMLIFVPFYLYRRLVQDKRPALVFAGGPHLSELPEGADDLGGRREVIHGD